MEGLLLYCNIGWSDVSLHHFNMQYYEQMIILEHNFMSKQLLKKVEKKSPICILSTITVKMI